MITTLAKRLHGSVVVAANLRGQSRIPFLSRDRIEALRDERVRRVVRHAARAVPFYRDWFTGERLDPRDIRTAADLERLPLLDRSLVRSQPRLFLAESGDAAGALSFLTSGSTGAPAEIWHDRRSLLANIAYGERERLPVVQLSGRFRPKELYAGYETSTFKKVIAFYETNVLMPLRPQRRFVSLNEPVERVAAVAEEERPDVLTGYGGWLDLFFKTVHAKGIMLPPLKLVLYMGEALPHGSRAFIEEHFRVPVLSRYNAVEAFKIGFCCERGGAFHLHEDLCHVRIAGAGGRTVPVGEPGEVVISNLVNRATVLLNYPIGDVAALSPAACPCGRTFRLLAELEGRTEDVLSLAGGSSVHPRSVWEVFKGEPGLLQYQLTQHELQKFELKVATSDEDAFKGVLDRTLPRLRRLLGPGAGIAAVRTGEVRRLPGEKFRAVASRCGQTASSAP